MSAVAFGFAIVATLFTSVQISENQRALIPENVRDAFIAEFQHYEFLQSAYETEKLNDKRFTYAERNVDLSRKYEREAHAALSKSRSFIEANTGDGSKRTKTFSKLRMSSIALAYAIAHNQVANDPNNGSYINELLPHIKDTEFRPLGTFADFCSNQAKPLSVKTFHEFTSKLIEVLTEDVEVAKSDFSTFEREIPEELSLYWTLMPKSKVVFGYFCNVKPSGELKKIEREIKSSGAALGKIWPQWREEFYTVKPPSVM